MQRRFKSIIEDMLLLQLTGNNNALDCKEIKYQQLEETRELTWNQYRFVGQTKN